MSQDSSVCNWIKMMVFISISKATFPKEDTQKLVWCQVQKAHHNVFFSWLLRGASVHCSQRITILLSRCTFCLQGQYLTSICYSSTIFFVFLFLVCLYIKLWSEEWIHFTKSAVGSYINFRKHGERLSGDWCWLCKVFFVCYSLNWVKLVAIKS
jgi:hypothetical protein